MEKLFQKYVIDAKFLRFIYNHLLMTGTTSAPSCLAGVFLRAKDPLMKSFWTSTTSNAVLGFRT